MAITKVEHLDDKVRISYEFRQPSGVPDASTLEITYSDTHTLPLLPSGEKGDVVYLPKINRHIVLVERSIREPDTSSGCRSWSYQVYRQGEAESSPA